MRSRTSLAVALSLCGVACKEPPSYRARWDIVADAPPGCIHGVSPELDTSCECSERGLGEIRLVTRDADGIPVDVRTRPCFPPTFADLDATVAGPSLPPGEYAVEVRGTKRQRAADELRVGPDFEHLHFTLVWGEDQYSFAWIENDSTDDPDDLQIDFIEPATPSCTAEMEDPACVAGAIACDCLPLVITGDETVELSGFELAAPPQCDNGVDDDQDGLVDGADPACTSPSGKEDAPIGGAQVQLEVAFFDSNPFVTCALLGVQGLRASMFNGVCPPQGAVPESTTDLACVIGSTVFSVSGAVGDKCIEIVALDADGQPRTSAEQRGLKLVPGPPIFATYEVDFEAGDFVPPIAERSSFGLKFDGGDGLPRGCTAEDLPDIATVEIEVLDAHGGALPVPITDATGAPLDGSPRPCTDGTISTEVLTWGGYSLAVVARDADDTLCFDTGALPIPLAPGGLALVVPAAACP